MKRVLTTLGVTALLLAGCGNNQQTATETTSTDAATTDAASDITIATESSFRPFSYTDADGNLIGFEIDLANALCEQMQANCNIISQDWDGLIPGLNASKFDAIMAGMSVTPEREQVVQFSDGYFDNALVLLGAKGVPASMDALAGKTVAAQRATVAAQYLADNFPDVEIKLYDTQDNAYLDLKAGRADVMLSDKVPAIDWLKTDAGADYEVKGAEIDIDDHIAIALRKDDPLVEKFNTALAELKASGKYDEIANTYFSTTSTAAAQAATPSVEVTQDEVTPDEVTPEAEAEAPLAEVEVVDSGATSSAAGSAATSEAAAPEAETAN